EPFVTVKPNCCAVSRPRGAEWPLDPGRVACQQHAHELRQVVTLAAGVFRQPRRRGRGTYQLLYRQRRAYLDWHTDDDHTVRPYRSMQVCEDQWLDIGGTMFQHFHTDHRIEALLKIGGAQRRD